MKKAFLSSPIMEDGYKDLERIEEGTYGVVYKAIDIKTGIKVAMKKLKLENEREGFPLTSLREIIAMRSLKANNKNIVPIKEVVIGHKDNSIYIVMDFLDDDMAHLLTRRGRFPLSIVRGYLQQLLRGIDGMHQKNLVHRDLKPSNLLIKDSLLQIADFGLTRLINNATTTTTTTLTPIVQTLWYRAPEILLGQGVYDSKIDLWSIGLIMAEMLSGTPIIREETEIAQLSSIFKLLGKPKNLNFLKNPSRIPLKAQILEDSVIFANIKALIPHINDVSMNLLLNFLEFDPSKRISAKDALNHSFFDTNDDYHSRIHDRNVRDRHDRNDHDRHDSSNPNDRIRNYRRDYRIKDDREFIDERNHSRSFIDRRNYNSRHRDDDNQSYSSNHRGNDRRSGGGGGGGGDKDQKRN